MNNLYTAASSLGKRGLNVNANAAANEREGKDQENGQLIQGQGVSTVSTMPSNESVETMRKYWVLVAQQINAFLESIRGIALGGPTTLNEYGMFEGLVKGGKAVSIGKITVENGVYYGHFINGHLAGELGSRLTMSPPDVTYQGISYVGTLLDNLPHGHGVQYRADGSEAYRGNWLNAQPHGYGTETSPNGARYVGNWNKGTKEGHGILYPENSDVKAYDGGWLNNLFHGKGKIFRADGAVKAEGTFVEGALDGEVCTLVYGKLRGKYVGSFKAGKRHGTGIMYDVGGSMHRVVMNEGKEVSREPYFEDAK